MNYWAEDKRESERRGVLWLPVVYPGFAWTNLKGKSAGSSTIPRDGGRFLWEQFHELAKLGADSVFVAMFDEVDEGTAIFKVTSSPPTQAHFEGYDGLPSDWYLRLVGEGAEDAPEGAADLGGDPDPTLKTRSKARDFIKALANRSAGGYLPEASRPETRPGREGVVPSRPKTSRSARSIDRETPSQETPHARDLPMRRLQRDLERRGRADRMSEVRKPVRRAGRLVDQ